MATKYATMNEAALAGMDACKRTQPDDKECGFGVYQGADGGFYHTELHSGKSGSIDGMKLRFPANASLVAIGHTHPMGGKGAEDTSDSFSKEDVKYAKLNGLHMFMGSPKSGKVVHYKEGETKAEKHSLRGRISYGTPIGPYGLEPVAPPTPPELTRREEIAKAYEEAAKNAPLIQNIP